MKNLRMKAIGLALLAALCASVHAQGVAGPDGWPAVQTSDRTTFRPPNGDDVSMSIVELKEAPRDLGAWIRTQSPNVTIQQSNHLMVLDGRPLEMAMGQDSNTGAILIAFARSQDNGLRIVLLTSSSIKLASTNLSVLTTAASQYEAWPQNLSPSAGGAHTPSATPKNGQRQIVYNPATHQFHIATDCDPTAQLSGSYAYVSDLFASPIGKSVLPGAATAMIIFAGTEFALAGTPAGSFTQSGASLTLQYPTKEKERFKIAVLDIAEGVSTKCAIGPCIYVRTDLTGGTWASKSP